jgi:synaptojanin
MNILLRPGKKRTLALESTTHVLLFRYIPETEKCAIEMIDKSTFISAPYKQLSRSKPHGFLGLIEMNGDIFLCVITTRVNVAQPLNDENINKIGDVEFHSLTNDSWDFLDLNSNGYPSVDADGVSSQPGDYVPRTPQHPCWELRKLLSDGSFFYSSDFDLTSTLQGRGVNIKQRLSVDNFHTDYMWNDFMMDGIVNFRNNLSEKDKLILDKDQFLTTVIRGFAETLNTSVNGRNAKMTIISKQSWKRAGTRFNVRGADDDGNVANFVETEMIFNDGREVFSFSQIRGSIPVFWEQDTALISPKVQITRSYDATHPTFEKHFDNLNSKYGPIHIVNLLSKTRSSEIELSDTYKEHFKELNKTHSDSVFFTDFDFHQETSKTYADATRLLPLLQESFEDFGYFLYDIESGRTLNEQTGTFRTNCLDCLDRTNVIQQVISLKALMDYLHRRNVRDLSNVKNKHSTLWADHGDRISQIYTGTNALKSSFSRSGKMGFAGALSDATKSLSRIYINNFVDKGKQQVTDTLLGKISSQRQVEIYDPITDYVNEQLEKFESKFTTFDDITIFTGTFNLAGAHQNKNLTDWLFPNEGFSPDIFVVGFQEVVELNASNILKSDGSVGQYWSKEVEKTIQNNSKDGYVLLRSELMSSILLLLFVKSKHVPNVTEVEGKSKKTGLGGMTANKGTVAIRLNFNSTSFCFVNSHLASGLQYTDERNNDFISSWNGIRFSRNRYIKHHDNIIWLGDLNYRVTIPNDKVRSLIAQNDISTLLARDQLSYQMMRIKEFKYFKESPISFPPTYKFDKLSDNYDSSEKQRVPAWTDRILFHGKYLNSLVYDIASIIRFSDHRPVYNIFSSRVKIIDEDLKDRIIKKLQEGYKVDVQTKSNHIELNDASSASSSLSPSIASTPTSMASSSKTANLIDLDTNSTISPPLPRRAVPPAYNLEETKNMLISGLTPASIQNSFNVQPPNTHSTLASSPPKLPARINTQVTNPEITKTTGVPSFTVMTPTLSRSGSVPPPPPPRKPIQSSTAINDSSSSRTSVASSPQLSTSPSTPITTKDHRVPPIVPVKPKVLNTLFMENESATHGSTPVSTSNSSVTTSATLSSWAPMTPTKKM